MRDMKRRRIWRLWIAAWLCLAALLGGAGVAEQAFEIIEDENGETQFSFEQFSDMTGAGEGEDPAEAVQSVDTGVPGASAFPSTSLQGADDPWPREIVVTVGGDCTLGSVEAHRERIEGFPYVVRDMGFAWPFSELVKVFGADDLTLVNFEGALTESTDERDKPYNFKGPAEYAQMLVLGSVEAVNLANNHTADYGAQGVADTKAALDKYGVTYCAQGEPAVYETRGVKIGLIGNTFPYTDGKRDISKDVKALREAGCQIVIASFHWGSEYDFDFSGEQRSLGRAAIRAGADVVVGHHPHVIQGIEMYEDTYILYSLGNLVFGGNIEPDHRDTYIAQLTFTVQQSGEMEGPELTIIPMRVTAADKGYTDYRPVFAEGETYERIYKQIMNRSSNMDGFVNPE